MYTKYETALSGAYPNPATETVSFYYALSNKETAGRRIVMRDAMGHIVEAVVTNGSQGEVHLSVAHLPDGFYTVALEVDSRIVATQKLIVQH